MSGAKKAVRLVDLEQPVGEIELPNGRIVQVMPIDGGGQQLRLAIIAKTATDEDIWMFARRMLPKDVTEEEILSLTPTMVGIIAEIACGHLDAVLEYAAGLTEGKVMAPTPTAPSSSPETGSQTS
jgi:hypothetical protein